MNSMSASDVLAYRSLSDVQISADGEYVSYVMADPYRIKGEEKEHSSIWIHDFRNNMTYCVSGGLLHCASPRFSIDGLRLAFLGQSEAGSKAQIYLFEISSGRLLQLTTIEGEIERFEWSAGNDRLYLLMTEKAKLQDDPEKFEEDTDFSCLHSIDLQTSEIQQIISGYQVWEFAVSPDSRYAVVLASDEPYEWCWHVAKLILVDLEAKTSKVLFDPRPRQIGELKWSEDGKSVYFISGIISDRGLTSGDMFSISPFSGEKPLNLTNNELGTVHFYDYTVDGNLLALSVDMSRSVFSILGPSQSGVKKAELGKFDFWVNPRFQPRFSISRSRQIIAVVREDPDSQQEIWIGQLSESSISWNRLTSLNQEQGQKWKAECKLVEWKSSDGTMIQGFLYRPLDAPMKLPLIVNIHGGPSMSYGFNFNQQARFFLSRGFSVFLPNPRGSTGRGPAFSEMNRGNLDGKDFEDILAGIGHLTKTGMADPSNLFVMGGSYGGYLVAWAITHSDIFNAAVMNFGISNLLSCHGTEWNIYWDEFLFDINPYKEPEKYHRKSPIDFVENAKTPTLILHGKEDPCVPVGQGRELFRALKELGVETRMVVYPREKHGWTEKEHIIDALQRQADWFAAHLNG